MSANNCLHRPAWAAWERRGRQSWFSGGCCSWHSCRLQSRGFSWDSCCTRCQSRLLSWSFCWSHCWRRCRSRRWCCCRRRCRGSRRHHRRGRGRKSWRFCFERSRRCCSRSRGRASSFALDFYTHFIAIIGAAEKRQAACAVAAKCTTSSDWDILTFALWEYRARVIDKLTSAVSNVNKSRAGLAWIRGILRNHALGFWDNAGRVIVVCNSIGDLQSTLALSGAGVSRNAGTFVGEDHGIDNGEDCCNGKETDAKNHGKFCPIRLVSPPRSHIVRDVGASSALAILFHVLNRCRHARHLARSPFRTPIPKLQPCPNTLYVPQKDQLPTNELAS